MTLSLAHSNLLGSQASVPVAPIHQPNSQIQILCPVFLGILIPTNCEEQGKEEEQLPGRQ